MMFVVDKPKLQRMISLVRDDRAGRSRVGGPFMRIEAGKDRLKLTGRRMEAEFPATVYEPGVLFLRVATLASMLRGLPIDQLGTRHLTFQMTPAGLTFADTQLDFAVGDMLLYPDPSTAPARHPDERTLDPSEPGRGDNGRGTLFEGA